MNPIPVIRNIWAVGRNYADHAKELGNAIPEEPMLFLKAGTCASYSSEIRLPTSMTEVHHEIELALQFDQNLTISSAAIALDLTDRLKQSELKAKAWPWTLAKSFIGACPLSDFFKVNGLEELKNLDLKLKVNHETRQQGNTNQMIFPLEQLLQFVLTHFPVAPGDLLLTGTPAGVGPLRRGDQVEAEIRGKASKSWIVV